MIPGLCDHETNAMMGWEASTTSEVGVGREALVHETEIKIDVVEALVHKTDIEIGVTSSLPLKVQLMTRIEIVRMTMLLRKMARSLLDEQEEK